MVACEKPIWIGLKLESIGSYKDRARSMVAIGSSSLSDRSIYIAMGRFLDD